jgi:hypothetical protein
MRDSRACCSRPGAGHSSSRSGTNALSDGAPAAERPSAAQQILSSELARPTDAAELQLTRPFGGSIADKPESIHDTSCRASGAGTAVTPRGSPAGRQRAGNRSAVSMSAPAAIRGAMDRSRGGADRATLACSAGRSPQSIDLSQCARNGTTGTRQAPGQSCLDRIDEQRTNDWRRGRSAFHHQYRNGVSGKYKMRGHQLFCERQHPCAVEVAETISNLDFCPFDVAQVAHSF